MSKFVGKYVLVRTYSAGVHAGVLTEQDGDIVYLKDARRCWSWHAAKGVALSGVARFGMKVGGDVKIDVELEEAMLLGTIEVMPCTPEAEASIRGWAGKDG